MLAKQVWIGRIGWIEGVEYLPFPRKMGDSGQESCRRSSVLFDDLKRAECEEAGNLER